MMEYDIVELKGLQATKKELNALIKEVWKPLGGICVTNIATENGVDSWYAQAMIRESHPLYAIDTQNNKVIAVHELN